MIGYTLKVYADGTKKWYLNDKLHRKDGPSIEWGNGTKSWYLNGKRHREDGPAVECASGTKFWYLNDKLHRADGPAVEYADGDKEWYLDDKFLTEQKHKKATTKATCAGKEIEIDGVVYVLREKENG